MEDSFTILAVCDQCSRVYWPGPQLQSTCTFCEAPLFRVSRKSGSKKAERFLLSYPYRSASSQLQTLVNRDGMEAALLAYHNTPESPPGVYCSPLDGRVMKTIKDPKDRPFFSRSPEEEDNELRIGIQIGFDGYDVSAYSHK